MKMKRREVEEGRRAEGEAVEEVEVVTPQDVSRSDGGGGGGDRRG